MKKYYHREITTQALSAQFSPEALEQIIVANLGQDALHYQVGHDHFHYDANSFPAGDAYCANLRQGIPVALKQKNVAGARAFFGRLTHTVQDFYAHSNYVTLWRELYPNSVPEEIHPKLDELIRHPHLHSGKIYWPLELFSFFPLFEPAVLPLLPRDSHAWMNKDDPSRPDFDFAFIAAKKRTLHEFNQVSESLTVEETFALTGQPVSG